MTYSTKQINSNFRIKVFGTADGRKYNTLVGCSGAINIIGAEMFDKLTIRAFRSTGDCCHCRLRRGLKVSFYVR